MLNELPPPSVLCLASYEKGSDFLAECKRAGCYVILMTVDKLAGAPWPRENIDELLTLPDLYDRHAVIQAASFLARTRVIDRVVALDDYDVETAAALREHLRCPGMGDTTARYFRDKLAMRVQARDKGLLVPPFIPVLNYAQMAEFMQSTKPPWVLKPRSEAAAVGIRRVYKADDLWPLLDMLGDRQSYYLLEQYIPGDVFHVDALVAEREVIFAEAHRYGSPPLDVAHEGGIFTSRTIRGSSDAWALQALNREVLMTLGFVRGVTHTEFIKAHDGGQFYFLETAARVGGAHIVELIEASTGLNLWAEWAKIEIAGGDRTPYTLPAHRQEYGGIIISLARQEWPDTGAYQDPEIVWRLETGHHAGLVVVSRDPARIEQLLESYRMRFYEDFYASHPAPDKPTQ
jgi:hypothetical protein